MRRQLGADVCICVRSESFDLVLFSYPDAFEEWVFGVSDL